ncbi:MAG TPA: helix-turn-helix domain-containing protein [Fimbriimonadaceae bacterium]|nr:helix-turn-helix domain-containing protein [Fimbriimonadaceae bacterium]
MNLADAIRRAALSGGTPVGTEAEKPQAAVPAKPEPVAPSGEENLAKEQNMMQPSEATETLPGHNVVRLELVLNPEQLKSFFGAVIASQHSVLTLREAAGFLRVSQGALEKMASEGEVPGMSVDGKWRFTRQALEDWLNAHPKRKEA